MLHIKTTVCSGSFLRESDFQLTAGDKCSGSFLRESNFQLTAGNNLAHDSHALLALLTTVDREIFVMV